LAKVKSSAIFLRAYNDGPDPMMRAISEPPVKAFQIARWSEYPTPSTAAPINRLTSFLQCNVGLADDVCPTLPRLSFLHICSNRGTRPQQLLSPRFDSSQPVHQTHATSKAKSSVLFDIGMALFNFLLISPASKSL
jgi:hypothetical protein